MIKPNYPRLIKAIRSLCFSETEVKHAFLNWIHYKDEWGSEAQNNYGGFKAMIRQARRTHSYKIKHGLHL